MLQSVVFVLKFHYLHVYSFLIRVLTAMISCINLLAIIYGGWKWKMTLAVYLSILCEMEMEMENKATLHQKPMKKKT